MMMHSTCARAIALTNQVRRTCQFMDGTVPKAAQRATPRACSRVVFLGERMATTGSEVIPVACLRAPLRNTKSWMPNDFPLPGRAAENRWASRIWCCAVEHASRQQGSPRFLWLPFVRPRIPHENKLWESLFVQQQILD